jgi:uncharacterized membrane protein
MTSGAVLDKGHDALAGNRAELIQTNLRADQEQELREVFA